MTRPSEHLLQFFQYEHLPEHLKALSRPCADLAKEVDRMLPEGPEKTAGLRKLLEAKDCFVRVGLTAEYRDSRLVDGSERPA